MSASLVGSEMCIRDSSRGVWLALFSRSPAPRANMIGTGASVALPSWMRPCASMESGSGVASGARRAGPGLGMYRAADY
eukprot:9399551-Alexandrium_andersonii.AAC.1